jgi:catechol 2,3-dioxygenase-like lactoylglutathione lyase family enzyme
MKSTTAFRNLLFASPILSGSSAFVLDTTNKGHPTSTTLRAGEDIMEEASRTEHPPATNTNTKPNNPIDVFGIDHVVLFVDDLEGMADWYETVLGCRVAKHNEKFKMIHLDAGSALIDLVDKTGPLGNNKSKSNSNSKNENENETAETNNSYQKMDHICLGLTSFDEPAIRDHLSAHGVTITTELGVRYGKNGYGESIYFEDPEGTRIEIKKSGLL